ncbi:MAG: membrane or secreted protein [Cytophagales bacterium]|nr:MAG: membrane or secreted protein [Cytophagales bacterium]
MQYIIIAILSLWISPAKQISLDGAWRLRHSETEETVKIYQDGYFMFARYDKVQKKFVHAGGGTYTLKGKKYQEKIEYFSADSTKVGSAWESKISGRGEGKLIFRLKKEEIWEKIAEENNSLTGNWRITARADASGKMNAMQRGARKTLKILSGSRFQWAAINPETKQFSGTGGGTYTAANGKYTENIEFFSRDNTRVGASLSFDFEVKANDWLHSGLSSKGDKISEVWSREK